MIGVWLVVSVNGRMDFTSARFLGNLLTRGEIDFYVRAHSGWWVVPS